uniref:sugar phosphate nucleotidyltransferase n=1 Tax=Rhizobium sp. TaxID=391 RepID=UPI0028A94CED
DEEAFCFTYGDGVSDVNIRELVDFHKRHGGLATLTATYPPARFGALDIQSDQRITSFKEKPKGDGGMINGGFFVLSPKVVDFIEGDNTPWEHAPLENLATQGKLFAYEHTGFWQPMDTLRDKHLLEDLWARGKAPWRIWE